MSTWTETVTYIKSQLRPGVLGNTTVQKILNAVLAVVQQINGGDFSPTPDALWKADVTYAPDIQPVLWQDQWLVSNIADNLGNVPISTSGVVHPTWRVIGSSAGSGIRFWQPLVYPNSLEIVFQLGQLYYLDRGLVGEDPFVSVDFAVELGEDKWVALLEIPEHNSLTGLQGGAPEQYLHLSQEEYDALTQITRSLDEDFNPIEYQFPTPVKGSPAIDDDQFVTKSQLPNIPQYGLINGGTIQWTGSGLTYVSSLAVVAIGALLTAPAATITLDAADATNPRFDVLGWRYVSPGIAELFYLKGTPAASPTIPQVNPESQVEGLVILVPALATAPSGVTTENIYLNNAEWAVTFSGTGTGNADSTTNPDTGTKAVELTSVANQFRVRFRRATTLDLSTLTDPTLGIRLDLKAAYSSTQNLELVFLDAANNPVSNVRTLAINKAQLDYQFIGVNLSEFTFTSQTIQAIEIIYRQRGGGTHAGLWLDNLKIQGGVTQPVSPGGSAGEKGWSPILSVVTDGARRVLQVSDWTGGAGAKPATGQYIGASGLTSTIGDAVDVRGAAGIDGKEVEFQTSATHIQWRYVGDPSWTNLVALSALKGDDGREVELQVNGSDMLQWRYVGDATWIDLFDLTSLGGGSGVPPGGTTGQVLTKNSATDGDASWQDPTGGGGAAAANAGSRLYLFNNY